MSLQHKAFKFKIHPTEEQKQTIIQTIGCSRFVFNHVLYENLKLPKIQSKVNAIKTLPLLKKTNKFLKEADSVALQASIEYLYEGYDRFFKEPKVLKKRGIKKMANGGTPTSYDYKAHPQFKTRKNPVQSYTTKCIKDKNGNSNIEIQNNYIKLPKLGWVRFSKSREIEGNVKRVTVRRNGLGKFFVSIICELPYSYYEPAKNNIVGIDMGLKDFAILSNGSVVENPKYYQKLEKRLGFLQKALARKQEGSNSWKQNKDQILKLHEKIKHKREDFLHKLSTKLVHENQVIGIETLKVKNRVKNHNLSKSIHDVSWSTFVRLLEYKSAWHGRTLVKIDTFFPSSQLCHVCGAQNEEVKNLNIRTWTCASCGTEHDRDLNASKNIEKEAFRLLHA